PQRIRDAQVVAEDGRHAEPRLEERGVRTRRGVGDVARAKLSLQEGVVRPQTPADAGGDLQSETCAGERFAREPDRRMPAVVSERRRRAPPWGIEVAPAEREVRARLGQITDAARQAKAQMVWPLTVGAGAEQTVPRYGVAGRRLAAVGNLMPVALRLPAAEWDVHGPMQMLDPRHSEHADRQRGLVRRAARRIVRQTRARQISEVRIGAIVEQR